MRQNPTKSAYQSQVNDQRCDKPLSKSKGRLPEKKDKLGLLAQAWGGRGRKGLGGPNPLNRFLKICLK